MTSGLHPGATATQVEGSSTSVESSLGEFIAGASKALGLQRIPARSREALAVLSKGARLRRASKHVIGASINSR